MSTHVMNIKESIIYGPNEYTFIVIAARLLDMIVLVIY